MSFKAIIKFDDADKKDCILLEEEQLRTVKETVKKLFLDGYVEVINKDADSKEVSSFYNLDEIDKIVIIET